MKFNQGIHRIATMCRLLGVSSTGFHAWLRRGPSKLAREDGPLTARIRHSHERSDGTYGRPRIRRDLADEGFLMGRKQVARLVRQAGLQGASHPKRQRTTTRGRDPSLGLGAPVHVHGLRESVQEQGGSCPRWVRQGTATTTPSAIASSPPWNANGSKDSGGVSRRLLTNVDQVFGG